MPAVSPTTSASDPASPGRLRRSQQRSDPSSDRCPTGSAVPAPARTREPRRGSQVRTRAAATFGGHQRGRSGKGRPRNDHRTATRSNAKFTCRRSAGRTKPGRLTETSDRPTRLLVRCRSERTVSRHPFTSTDEVRQMVGQRSAEMTNSLATGRKSASDQAVGEQSWGNRTRALFDAQASLPTSQIRGPLARSPRGPLTWCFRSSGGRIRTYDLWVMRRTRGVPGGPPGPHSPVADQQLSACRSRRVPALPAVLATSLLPPLLPDPA